MKIIVPCGGRSSRYPHMPPKWMLPTFDGRPMVQLAVEGLEPDPASLIITILREHEQQFGASEGLRRAFGGDVQIIVLEQPTRSQSETVLRTLEAAQIDKPFLVKDSDNAFTLRPVDAEYNYVSVASLNDFDHINPRNKSYVQIDAEDIIFNIREKRVISDTFSVGGYFFRDAARFRSAYESLANRPELGGSEIYVSDMIAYMILNGETFKARRVAGYRDWGTVHEWKRALESKKVLFVSLDGFVFERGSDFFKPKFAEVRPNQGAIEALRHAADQGHELVYLSIRSAKEEPGARGALAAVGAPPGKILFDLPQAQWSLITSPHPSLPFATSSAFELSADDPNLTDKLDLAP